MSLGFIKAPIYALPVSISHALGSGIGPKHLMGKDHSTAHMKMRLMRYFAQRHPHQHRSEVKGEIQGEGVKHHEHKHNEQKAHQKEHKTAGSKQNGGLVGRKGKPPAKRGNGRSINQLLAEALR